MDIVGRSAGRGKGRILIVGAGKVGFHTARFLAEENKQVVVIDSSAEQIRHVQESLDVQTLKGSGASPRILEEAGIREADIVLAVTDNDEINIMTCMLAKGLAPDAVKVARIRNPDYATYPDLLEQVLDIHLLINPEEEIVRSVNRLLTLSGAVEYGEFSDRRIRMVGMRVTGGPLVDQPLMRFRSIVQTDGLMVGAIVRQKKLIVPSGQDRILKGDIVYFVYLAEKLSALLSCVRSKRCYLQTVCIYGGGNIGVRLAQLLDKKGVRVKVIDHDMARCQELAELLPGCLVLHGEGTDKSLLEEERVGEMDAFVAVTGDEESNILSCMLARSLGVGETVVSVDKDEYLPLIEAFGIEHSVSTRIAAVSSLLHYVRQGGVLASLSVGREAAEAVEVRIRPEARIAGLSIQEMGLPRGVLLLAILREEAVFVPTGQTTVMAGDRILLLAERRRISEVEQLLADDREGSV